MKEIKDLTQEELKTEYFNEIKEVKKKLLINYKKINDCLIFINKYNDFFYKKLNKEDKINIPIEYIDCLKEDAFIKYTEYHDELIDYLNRSEKYLKLLRDLREISGINV